MFMTLIFGIAETFSTRVARGSALAESAECFFASTNDGVAVGEQQMIECLLLTNPQERCLQTTRDCKWVITNQRVGHKAELTIFVDNRITD